MTAETRQCQWCGAIVAREQFCPGCTESFARRPAPETMTADAREQELRQLGESMEVEFDLVHGRIEQLVGRPVWTHEMGSAGWATLIEEARGDRARATLEQIMERIPAEKRIVVEVP